MMEKRLAEKVAAIHEMLDETNAEMEALCSADRIQQWSMAEEFGVKLDKSACLARAFALAEVLDILEYDE